MVELRSLREAYADALVSLGLTMPKVVVLSADVNTSDYSNRFAEAYPSRYFDTGIAEMCMVDVAVGLANTGLIPMVNTFAIFMASRALEPIMTHLAYGRANVKLMAGYSGLSPQYEGPTHHAITDLAIMRALPNMAVVSPSDAVQMAALLPQVAEWDGPVYYRFSRNETAVLTDPAIRLCIGQAVRHRSGSDATIIANGTLVARAIAVAGALEAEGTHVAVVEVHTLKPLDREAILQEAATTGAIVTAEEHSVIGGLGSAVAEVVAGEGLGVPVVRVGLADRFADSGKHDELLDAFGMGAADIRQAVVDAMERRDRHQAPRARRGP
jgi:transketolase